MNEKPKCFPEKEGCLKRCEKCEIQPECEKTNHEWCRSMDIRFDAIEKVVQEAGLACFKCGKPVKANSTYLLCDCSIMSLPLKWFYGPLTSSTSNDAKTESVKGDR